MTSLENQWIQEIQRSRLIVLPADRSYVNEVGVSVWTLIQQLAGGSSERQLYERYPALTPADIRACMLFGYLRAIQAV